jgi:DNA-binding MarR family transcriptional regulator
MLGPPQSNAGARADDDHDRLFVAMTELVRALERPHASGAVIRVAGVQLPRNVHTVIASIGERGSARIGDVARDTGLDASAASKYIAVLAERGLVLRRADPADGRASIATLSARGRRVRAALRVNRTFRPEEAPEAHRLLEAGEVRGRLVLTF